MSNIATFPKLLESWFTDRLMRQQRVSPNTIASYRDAFRMLLVFASRELGKTPSTLDLADIDAPLISDYLDDLEKHRSISARTRNLRLTAIQSFFRFLAYEEPAHSAHIQRVLAVPGKRFSKKMIHFLERPEIEALLAVPDQATWIGRRDHALLQLAIQTGLRLAEIISLDRSSIVLGQGSHVRCIGKGRKERCTPLTRAVVRTMKAWLAESQKSGDNALFQTIHGGRLSADTVQYLVAKHVTVARTTCPSMRKKQITPHVLRHSAAMELLQAGVDSSVIAIWLGHESSQTTQMYLHAHMALKEAALAKVAPLKAGESIYYQPEDQLLNFLTNL